MTFITSSLGQDLEEGDITITLTLLNTSQFTLDNWQAEENLWYVVIQNQTSLEQKYKIKYQLKRDTEILTWGLSPEEIIQSNEIMILYCFLLFGIVC